MQVPPALFEKNNRWVQLYPIVLLWKYIPGVAAPNSTFIEIYTGDSCTNSSFIEIYTGGSSTSFLSKILTEQQKKREFQTIKNPNHVIAILTFTFVSLYRKKMKNGISY